MSNLMDNTPYNSTNYTNNERSLIQQFNEIRQNPKAFEERLKQTNPQAYQQALQIRNSSNPREAILNLARQKGVNPNIFRMFGLM